MAEKIKQNEFDKLVTNALDEFFEKYMPAILDEHIAYGRWLYSIKNKLWPETNSYTISISYWNCPNCNLAISMCDWDKCPECGYEFMSNYQMPDNVLEVREVRFDTSYIDEKAKKIKWKG